MVVCRTLLNRDPEKRPSAQEALNHPWLQGDVSDRSKGKPLSFQVHNVCHPALTTPCEPSCSFQTLTYTGRCVCAQGPDAAGTASLAEL